MTMAKTTLRVDLELIGLAPAQIQPAPARPMTAATRPAPATPVCCVAAAAGWACSDAVAATHIGEGGLSRCDNAGQSNCGKDGTEHLISPVLAYQAGEFDGSN